MNKTETKLFCEILSEIPDYRRGNAVRHKLNELLSIAILGILCNANTLTGLECFGKTHEEALRTIFELPYGIPSHDTFGDVLGKIDYEAVEQLFRKWLTKIRGDIESVSIAIDGKTIRHSASPLQKAAHVVILNSIVNASMSWSFSAPALPLSVSVGAATLPSFGFAEAKKSCAHQCVNSFVQYNSVFIRSAACVGAGAD